MQLIIICDDPDNHDDNLWLVGVCMLEYALYNHDDNLLLEYVCWSMRFIIMMIIFGWSMHLIIT